MSENTVWVLAQPTFAHHERGEYVVKRGVLAAPLRVIGSDLQTFVVIDDASGQILGEYLKGGMFTSEDAALRRLSIVRG